MAWTETGQELWRHTGNRGVDVDGGEHPEVLREQAVEHQQGQRRLRRVGVDDDVTEGAVVLMRRRQR